MIKYKRPVRVYRAEDPDQSSSDQELPQGKLTVPSPNAMGTTQSISLA